MSLIEPAQFTDGFALQAHNRAIRARVRAGYFPPQAQANVEPLLAEIRALKVERDQYRAVAHNLQTEIVALGAKLERFTNRLSNLQRDAITAQEVEAKKPIEPVDILPVNKVNIERVIRAACGHYKKGRAEFLSARRTNDLVRPRQVAMYLAKTLTTRSLPEIGRRFGGRDHTTVLHAIRKIEALLPVDEKIAEAVRVLSVQLVAPKNSCAPIGA